MASVYNLIGNPSGVSREIIREHGRLEMPIRIRYFAALTIQRCYRGYKVRCIVRYWHNMATVIQKVVRGWLVRWHRVDYLKQYLARMEERDLNNNARKIQAFYRGYQVRKTLSMPIKELVKQKQLTEQQSANMREIMRQKFQALRLYGRRSSVSISQDIDQDTMGEECKRWVLFILFKTHHLIRTYCKEGIYSIHGSK
ncbi:IQ calmodulin-binding motif [Popillia japonica]|uniref:IQ calmodulin-binding motif n=1 Tax=Popillia japonica TaxID=7064 RepID=A0AAW1LVA5_POPJA